jgi:hypothetical protein
MLWGGHDGARLLSLSSDGSYRFVDPMSTDSEPRILTLRNSTNTGSGSSIKLVTGLNISHSRGTQGESSRLKFGTILKVNIYLFCSKSSLNFHVYFKIPFWFLHCYYLIFRFLNIVFFFAKYKPRRKEI